MNPLTPDMRRVLDRIKAGDQIGYHTTITGSGRTFFMTGEAETVREATIKGLIARGLVRKVYKFPTGAVVLTELGKRT